MKKITYFALICFVIMFSIFSVFIFSPIDYKHSEEINTINSSIQQIEVLKIVNLKESSNYKKGFAHGKLLKEEISDLNNSINEILEDKKIDSFISKIKLRILMKFYFSKTPEYIKEEIKGISDASNIDYERIYLLNVFDDIFNTAMCTNIAAFGEKTEGNSLIHGRNLDYLFQKYTWNKAVIFNYSNKNSNSFVSINYPGMVGTLTAMNDKGITLGSLTSEIKKNNVFGIPTGFLYRNVIKNADNIEDVSNILNDNKTTIGNNLMVTSKNNNLGVVFEITPNKIYMREANSVISAANHFEVLQNQNKNVLESSVYRANWSKELLSKFDFIDVEYIINILRDLEVNQPNGEPIANKRNVISAVFLPNKNHFFLATNEVVPASHGRFFHFKYENKTISLIDILDPGVEFLNFKNYNFNKKYDSKNIEKIKYYADVFLKSDSLYKPYKYSSTIEFLLSNEITINIDKYISYLYKYIETEDSRNFDKNDYKKSVETYFDKYNKDSLLDNFYIQKNNFYYSWFIFIEKGENDYLHDIINNVNYYEWLRKWAEELLHGGI
ncbi:MAG: C45 family autoproteolytic acyltransferase/hydrolase [Thermotogota bacterium]